MSIKWLKNILIHCTAMGTSPVRSNSCTPRLALSTLARNRVTKTASRKPPLTVEKQLSSEKIRTVTKAQLRLFLHATFASFVQCCFTSPVTVRTTRDGESRTSTSSFTQLSSRGSLVFCSFFFSFVVLYVHRNRIAYWGRGQSGIGNEGPGPSPCSHSS